MSDPSSFIQPLRINGLTGRLLCLPATKPTNREILVVYGHHAMLERWWGLVQNFNEFGNVTMPDLPGFGGMESLYKIVKKPTIDNLADYLADFIAMHYQKQPIVIAGTSFGFVVATRMLQRHPGLTKQIQLMLSCVGFAHTDDFTYTKRRLFMYRKLSKFVSLPGVSPVFKRLFLNQFILRNVYTKTHNARHKFAEAAGKSKATYQAVMNMEVKLWQINDVRTQMYTGHEFLHLDNTKVKVDVPVWHIGAKNDYYFNNANVEKHLRAIFSDYRHFTLDLKSHAPSVVATKEEAAVFLPPDLREALARLP